MRVAINGLGIHYKAGTGRHFTELVRHLAKADSPNQYLVILSQDQMAQLMDVDGSAVKWFVLPTNIRGMVRETVWNWSVLPTILRREHVDLIHFPEINRCFMPHEWPIIVTVHGLINFRIKGKDGFLRGLYHNRIIPRALKRADHLVAVSENTKRDIMDLVGVPDEKITVIPNGSTVWNELEDSSNSYRILAAHGVRMPYILFVSRIEHPNKNHVTLLRAFKELLEDSNDLQLVFVGEQGWRFDAVEKVIADLGLNDHVIMTGFVTDLELNTLYAGARAFVMPSLYEGFGIPVIEAMSMKIPVACSNTSSLAELAQDAAMVFDPHKPEEIANALRRILWDDNIRKELIEKGSRRASDFTWPAVAKKTVELYDQITRESSKT